MAITVTNESRGGKSPSAPTFVDEINILCDNTYPAGGWEVGLAAKLPSNAAVLAAFVDDVELTGYQFQYDRVNDKLMVFECKGAVGAMTELATATALNGKNVRLIVVSR